MSYGHILAAWKVTGLTPREKVVLLALAWVFGALIDAWGPAAAAIVVPVVLAERLLYVAWKERQA